MRKQHPKQSFKPSAKAPHPGAQQTCTSELRQKLINPQTGSCSINEQSRFVLSPKPTAGAKLPTFQVSVFRELSSWA